MAPSASHIDTPGDALPRPHPNCYWLLPGLILAGEYPGAADAARQAQRLQALLDAGVRCVINLTADSENLPAYAAPLHAAAAARAAALRIEHFPITDFGVPDVATMRRILAAMQQAVLAAEPLYLHCHGGIGRTGTVVGCWLIEQGYTADQALQLMARKWRVMAKRDRAPHSPETQAQRDFIAAWGDAAKIRP